MAFWDSIGDGWLWDSVSSGGGGGSGGFNWGSLDWDDLFGRGDGSSGLGGFDFDRILDSMDSWGDGGGDSGSGFWKGLSSLFGGGGDGDSGNIFGKMLAGGLGSMAEGLISEKAVKEAGKQARQNYSFQAELADFYSQKDKARKRAALDTYGQFSLLDRWAPGTQSTPQVDLPNKPQA